MKIAVLSDTHGHVPDVPDVDLLILSGDYVHTRKNDWLAQQRWVNNTFKPWLDELSQRMTIIGVAGNHDYILEYHKEALPELSWTYLENSGCEFQGLKVWGSPQNKWFFDWSFNKSEKELLEYWKLIPDDTNILILHQPPLGVADWVPYDQVSAGSSTLYDRLIDLKELRLVTVGHLHSNTGIHRKPFSFPIVSGCYVGENYRPNGLSPVILEI